MILNRARLLAFLFPLLLSAPFLNRAYFVDDSYFVEIATWLKDHPTLPYHFRADDAGPQTRGWEENGFVRMVNPLAHHYYLALLLKIGGEREWFLRLGCVLLSCFSGLFVFELARRWTSHALLSTFLVLATPVHWLTAHSLLIDSTAGFFFLGGLFFFIWGMERDSLSRLVVSGVFMGLAILTKYPSLLILPLTATWLAFRWKKTPRRWIAFMPWTIALGFLGAYSFYTTHLYGSPHILAASQRMVNVYGWAKVLTFFVFLSGASLVPLLSWGGLGAKRALVAGLIVYCCMLFFSSGFGGFTSTQAFLIGLWLTTSCVFMTAIVSLRKSWVYPRDWFLIAWLLEFVVLMMMVMGWVAGRYYVIVVPAIGLLTARFVEIKWPSSAERILQATLILLIVFTGALGYADYRQANTSRRLLADLEKAGYAGGAGRYYTGDSFTVSYLKKTGWIPCFPDTQLQVGDQILAKEVTMPSISFLKSPIVIRKAAVFDYPTWFPLKVMDMKGSAGFYASVWGALPFTFSHSPWERFHLFEVVALKELGSAELVGAGE